MAMLHLIGEQSSTSQDIEPMGYLALWQVMRRADAALGHHMLSYRIADYPLTEQYRQDLSVAADILDPDRSDSDARFTEYDVAIPPSQLVADFQDLIDTRKVQFEDKRFDATARLRLTANAFRQLAVKHDIALESMPVVFDTVSALLRHSLGQFAPKK
jgi:hypothetical protein